MKPRRDLVLAVCLMAHADAAPIIWDSATTIGADAQIVTSGSTVYAYTNSNVNQTVNGVAFTGVNSSTTWGGGNVTLALPSSTGTSTTAFLTPTGVSSAYGNLTKGAAYGGVGTGTISLNNLTSGRAYLAQIWVNDSRTTGSGRNETATSVGGNSVTLDYNSTETTGGAGQFTVGRFAADGASQAFTMTSSNSVQLNSIQVREVTNIGNWVGSGGATWDASTTNNFASNLFSSALATTTFDVAKAPLNSVTFADSYWNNGTATTVSQTAVTVGTGGVSTGRVYFDNNNVNYTISSADSNGITGTTAVYKTGSGTVTLAGHNTYTGATWISKGTLDIQAQTAASTYTIASGATLSLSTGSQINARNSTFAGTGTLRIQNGVTFGSGSATNTVAMGSGGLVWITNNVTVAGSSNGRGRWDTNQASLQVDAGSEINFVEAGSTSSDLGIRVNALSGGGTVRAGHNSGPGFRTLVVGEAGGSGSFSGTLADRATAQLLALHKQGAGTQTLSGTNSSYTGVTTMEGGILNVASLADYGVNSSLGARASAQEVPTNIGLRFMGGTLQYTGSTAQSTNRQIRIGTAGGTIDASGSTSAATVSFTHSGANTDLFDTAGTRTLTLTGTNTGANTFAIALQNQSGNATSLTKNGSGTWVLTGNSSYTGLTNINDGVLRVASVNALGGTAGNTVIPGGATPTARLELTGGLAFAAEPILLGARQGAAANAPHLSNVSGNNVWQGAITTTTGGANYNIESKAGHLTISGTVGLSQSGTRVLQLMGAGNGEISSTISGNANDAQVRKMGGGTWTLSGANNYTGNTSVNEGRLNINGSITSATTVAAIASLGGDGAINGNVSLAGKLLPGQGGTTNRTLTINGNVTTTAGSRIAFTATSMADHDQLVITGSGNSIGLNNADLDVTFAESLTFDILGAGQGDDFLAALDTYTGTGTWFKLIDGSTSGMFANVSNNPLTQGELSYFGLTGPHYAYNADNGQRFWVVGDSTYLVAIPEPRAAFLVSFAALLLFRRRRFRW